MVLNKKSQIFFYSLMLGILVLVLALSFAGPLKQTIDSARNITPEVNYTYEKSQPDGLPAILVNGTITTPGLDCSNSSISSFDKGACLVSDLSLFQFIGGLIFIAGSIITAKLIFSG